MGSHKSGNLSGIYFLGRKIKMSRRLSLITSALALAAGTASAQDMAFNRIASFATMLNNADNMAESSSEIMIVPRGVV